MEYPVKLLDKQRRVAIYHLGNFITKHLFLYAKPTLRSSSCTGESSDFLEWTSSQFPLSLWFLDHPVLAREISPAYWLSFCGFPIVSLGSEQQTVPILSHYVEKASMLEVDGEQPKEVLSQEIVTAI
jgi:hypothetical protein